MSDDYASASPTNSLLSLTSIPGLGENQIKPREIGSFFGYIPDAFSGRSPCLPSEVENPTSKMDAEPSRSISSQSSSSNNSLEVNLEDGDIIHETNEEVIENTCISSETNEVPVTSFYNSDAGVIAITGGRIVNSDSIVAADVLIKEGKITAIGENLDIADEAVVINATGKLVMPGGIDMSTHLHKGIASKVSVTDDFEVGSRKALLGGTTTIVDLVIPEQGKSLIEAFKDWKNVGEEKSLCDFALTVAVPKIIDAVKREMEILVKDHGVNSFKMFMAYKDSLMLDNTQLMEAFKHVKDLGCIAKVHAENGDMITENEKKLMEQGIRGPEGHLLARPEELEEEAVRRACTLALQASNPLYFCGVSAAGAVEIIKEFKSKGLVVKSDVTAASLCIDGSHCYDKCWKHAASFLTSPPLREGKANREKLLKSLLDGTVTCVTSDHCNYNETARASMGQEIFPNIPTGITGVRERMEVVYQTAVVGGGSDLSRMVELTSSGPAKLLNIFPKKGSISVGSDADIVIWNTSHQLNETEEERFGIFKGMNISGGVDIVMKGGKIVVAQNQLLEVHVSGQYVMTPPWPAICYDQINARENLEKPVAVKREEPVNEDKSKKLEKSNSMFGVTCPRGSRMQEVYNSHLEIYQRPLSAHGVRNQQDSSFSLVEHNNHKENDGVLKKRATVRVSAPPGGQARALW